MNLRQAILVIGLVAGGVAANACSDGSNDYNDACINPKRWDYDYVFCVEMRHDDACENPARKLYHGDFCERYRKDPASFRAGYFAEGPDAGADAADEVDGSSVRMGRCGPDAPKDFSDPEPVWFGPIDEAPADCPPKMGSYSSHDYAVLDIPQLDGCALCGCEPIEGTCLLATNTIHFRDAMCDGDASVTTEFGPLENWDGSCVSDHAVVANAECPAGSGIPCVQSIYASALPAPTQSCKPVEIPVPHAITDVPKWKEVALSCSSTPVPPSPALRKQFPPNTGDSYNTCVPGGIGWRTCVYPTNGQAKCDEKSSFRDKVVVYPQDAIIDTRQCSTCGCEPSGGACVATLNVYEDDACENILATETLDSNGPTCDDLMPPGKAIGSKDLTSLDYIPGSCKATGGIPHGDVVKDEAKAIIWCCLIKESALYNIDLE